MLNYFELAGAENSPNGTGKGANRSRLRRMWIAEQILDDAGKYAIKQQEIRDRVATELGDKVSLGQIGFDLRLLQFGRAAFLGEPLPEKRPAFVASGQWRALQTTQARAAAGGDVPPAAPPTTRTPRPPKIDAPSIPQLPPRPDPLQTLLGIAGAFRDFGVMLEDLVSDLKAHGLNGNGNGNGNGGNGHGGNGHHQTATLVAPVRVLPVEHFPPTESLKDELERGWPHTTKAGWRMAYSQHFVKQIMNLDAHGHALCLRTLQRFAINPSDPSLRRKRMIAPTLEKRYHNPEAKLHYIRATVTYRIFVNANDRKRIYIFEDWMKRGAIPGFTEK